MAECLTRFTSLDASCDQRSTVRTKKDVSISLQPVRSDVHVLQERPICHAANRCPIVRKHCSLDVDVFAGLRVFHDKFNTWRWSDRPSVL